MNPSVAPAVSPDVIVVGEALIDVVHARGTASEHPGGSPANVAYGLARLGVSTGFLTAIGNDARGHAIHAHLTGAGVELLPGSQSMPTTSTATATLADDGSASYTFDLTWDLASATPTHQPKILHTGSIASFLAPGSGKVRSILQHYAGTSTITYDPNIRPDLLGSHHEALAIFEDLVPLTNVVKLSNEDAAWLYPNKSPKDAGRHIINLGTDLVAVTLGAEGSQLLTAVTDVNIPAAPSIVADTIGAGDSYMAAFISGLLTRNTHGWTTSVLEPIGRMAAMAAAITVRRPGANPPTTDELQAHLEQPTAC
ncbi:carbohydrate kinase [Arthrobacter sp. SDTb3-6]|uniref:carbohydrate kinase family protein n=1 Tax=Arthrobacter sp. SDTb3-6 TaxID=2713571 RepID=UPI00159D2275|nr:carbohydrate kinase [Arthrobacter sp. SDTb3-6]NVM98401.1 carbohydrate kinase [Arthrobacter sp. SDTb3-6]